MTRYLVAHVDRWALVVGRSGVSVHRTGRRAWSVAVAALRRGV